MTDLRQRKAPKGLTLAQRNALLNSAPSGYQRTPRPPSRSNRSLHISISLLILAFFVIYAHNNKPAKTPYAVGGKKLPSWYAFCSKEGNRIYTIPESGGEGAVECVVVHGKFVADTGSLGAHILCHTSWAQSGLQKQRSGESMATERRLAPLTRRQSKSRRTVVCRSSTSSPATRSLL